MLVLTEHFLPEVFIRIIRLLVTMNRPTMNSTFPISISNFDKNNQNEKLHIL